MNLFFSFSFLFVFFPFSLPSLSLRRRQPLAALFVVLLLLATSYFDFILPDTLAVYLVFFACFGIRFHFSYR